jgi:hypothetical protein
MEPQAKSTQQLARALSNLKIVSRLLQHEVHAQATSKSITLSKDEVLELQTCIDLYIEDVSRRLSAHTPSAPTDMPLVTARNN